MHVLLTGGLGYIGSHTAVALLEKNIHVSIIDNLSNSKIETIDNIKKIIDQPFSVIIGDITDTTQNSALDQILNTDVDTIIHFAALKSVKESIINPSLYYYNNVLGTLNLLDKMVKHGKKRLIFSSSCTVYGNPESYPVTESTPLKEPESPYGKTKLICENIIIDYAKKCDINVIILRYFNPIGLHPSGFLYEDPNNIPENIMPYILGVINGKYTHLNVYGNDYNTPDGTAIRDYIDINDLADAHIKAIEICNKEPVQIFNIGTGLGSSVLDIIQAFKTIGIVVPYKIIDRRSGDIEKIFANTDKAKSQLDWTSKRNLENTLKSLINIKK